MSDIVSKEVSAPVPQSQDTAIIAVIERVALDPSVDISKLERMLDMQERVLARNAQQSFTADLAAMQMELPRVVEFGEGHNRAKYAKLEDINDVIRPTLHRYGFAITFRIRQSSGAICVVTVLSHRGGHSEETEIVLPPDNSGSKNSVQAVGSTISYGKRYGLCAMLNISTGDDNDGGTPVHQEQFMQPVKREPAPITDERLGSAIQKIKDGEFTLNRLRELFILNDEQENRLADEFKEEVTA